MTRVVDVLDRFVAKWGGQLAVCEVNRDALGCSLHLGSGENTVQSVSAEQARALLPDMIELAEALDSIPGRNPLGLEDDG